MKYTIEWEEKLISGNPKINPEKGDRESVLCFGSLSVEAKSESEAVRSFKANFPKARVRVS